MRWKLKKMKNSTKKRRATFRGSETELFKALNAIPPQDPRTLNEASLPEFFLWFGATEVQQ